MDNKKNGGAIFRQKKEKPTSPDYTGDIELDGIKWRLSCWVNKSKAGYNYLRILANKYNDGGDIQALYQMQTNYLDDINKAKDAAINNKPETDDLPF